MASRKPLVIVGGSPSELPAGDTLVGAGIADAPSDGKTYGRKDAAWAEIVSGGGGGSGLTWTTVSANTTMAAGTGYQVSGARDMTCAASATAGQFYIVHALDAAVRIIPGASNSIKRGGTTYASGTGDAITLAAGETIWLVASAAGVLEIS